ncbi:MAG: response regulator [Thermodesulfobacteriota bacterium]|nr:response regulator [Thermodesulfobacteriota bacterium]
MYDTLLLIVDDEERFLKTTSALLEKRECKVFTATNGMDALDILDNKKIDVVILDVKMPGMDGVETLRKIKKAHSLVEVIMLTGHSTTESAVEGLKLGAFDYLIKPCDIEIIMEKVKEAHEKKQSMEEKIDHAKIGKIVRHPTRVFEKD